jgi:hypothetical protein
MKEAAAFLRQAAAVPEGQMPSLEPPERQILTIALGELHLFNTDVARGIIRYRAVLEFAVGLQRRAEEYTGPNRWRAVARLRVQAAHALLELHDLVDQLLTEGGELPPRVTDRIIRPGEMPELPTGPFGEFNLMFGWQGEDED